MHEQSDVALAPAVQRDLDGADVEAARRVLSPVQALKQEEEMTREQELEFILKELLRLYDWRMELGAREKQGLVAPAELKKLLNTYGREKKEAWRLARNVLGNPHFQTERCGFDRNGSHGAHTYVCTCGWMEEPK